MFVVIPLWIGAMIAGLCWPRWAVTLWTAVTMLALVIQHPQTLIHPGGWLKIVAFGVTPWLLAAQRTRTERRIRRYQAIEAFRLSRLKERTQTVRRFQATNQELDTQVARITALYHVTKEISRALKVDQLFEAALDIVPRLLDVRGLRLIDCANGEESMKVFRAARSADGRLVPAEHGEALAFERAVLQQARASGLAGSADAQQLGAALPPDLARVAWASLWSERQLIGVLAADGVGDEEVSTLSIVANQLALQLAHVHLYRAIESMAITDTLTGLFVRRYFLELAQEELARATRHQLPCTLLMVDLDFFKSKNDTYGHLVGDVVLREVAQVLKKNLRGIDLIARYGGEEFIALLVETDVQPAAAIAERLRQLVEAYAIRAYDEVLSQTVSIGLAGAPAHGAELSRLVDRADQALYTAKRRGRNQVVMWSHEVSSFGSRVSS